jgi:hypothetical protein
MSLGLLCPLIVVGFASVTGGLYLLIRGLGWLGDLAVARSEKRSDARHNRAVRRISAQLGRHSHADRRSTGTTRLRRCGTPDATTTEAVSIAVMDLAGVAFGDTTTIPVIRDRPSGGTARTPDLTCAAAGSPLPGGAGDASFAGVQRPATVIDPQGPRAGEHSGPAIPLVPTVHRGAAVHHPLPHPSDQVFRASA